MTIVEDEEIAALLQEPKPAVALADLAVPQTQRRGHRGREKQVKGQAGTKFHLIVRQSINLPADFSVILAYAMPNVHRLFRLRRHNGPSHRHRNPIEGDRIDGPHIHLATQRYQEAGFREDAYAEPTDGYSDLAGAIEAMLTEENFERPSQDTIFSG